MNDKILVIIKFICVVYLVILIPKLGIFDAVNQKDRIRSDYTQYGIDTILARSKQYAFLKTLPIGVIANHIPGVKNQQTTEKRLKQHGFNIRKSLLLTDESLTDKSAISAISSQWLREIDVVMLDIRDFGIGFDGVSDFLSHVMHIAKDHEKQVIILDRPNQFGGIIEGPGKIPWRHGLTIGELALYLNKNELGGSVDLQVIPMSFWRRNRLIDVANAGKYVTSFLDPMSRIEPIRVGGRKDVSSQTLFFDNDQRLSPWEIRFLKRLCWRLGLQCISESYFDEGKQKRFDGVRIRLKEPIERFSAFNTLVTLVRFLSHRKHIQLSFPLEFYTCVGSSDVQKFFQDQMNFEILRRRTQATLDGFSHKAKDCFLYKPYPRVIYPELVKA